MYHRKQRTTETTTGNHSPCGGKQEGVVVSVLGSSALPAAYTLRELGRHTTSAGNSSTSYSSGGF